MRQRAGAGKWEAVGEEAVTPEVEALLAAVRRSAPRPGEADAQAALAAYREARDSGVHAGPERWWQARRRDDWRPSRRWRGVLPVRAAFASAAATVTLGGVALAAGTGAIPAPFGIGDGGSGGGGAAAVATGTHSSAQATPGAARGSAAGAAEEGAARLPSADVTRSGPPRPARARNDVANCVAYLVSHGRSASGRGAASEQLTADAEDAGLTVEAYCEGVLAAEKRQPGPGAGTGGKGSTKAPKGLKASKPGAAPGTPEEPPAKPDGDAAADPADPGNPAADPTQPADSEEDGNDGRQSANGTEGNGESGESGESESGKP
ncbi:hypothetical protein J7E96_02725 [Streptomyces sp. ISL-96]|uniref:hypothetical protein n=1 Tax=Streptomyces sp. ISL-96 TaxID=2819191 RepID=UPI001BE5CBFC|nr:hypothetical protein [Streptomyces sp. ISL-96]MBT2487471.1 hypothetical protein [Streptomyces sp. ISL-96]